MKPSYRPNSKAFTLIELLIVIAILALLGGISIPVYSGMKEKAQMAIEVANVKNIAVHTLTWAAEHSQTLPSPQYKNDPKPEHWDFVTSSGLWLDGVVYYEAMQEANGGEVDHISSVDGSHLKDTIFFSTQSFKKDPLDTNLYHHSYAMNKSLQHDYIYQNSGDADYTEKNLARITHRPSALLYIENRDSNVIGYQDTDAIIETGKNRWSTGKIVAVFLDGHALTLSKNDIPVKSVTEDRESSRFWRGVDPD